MINQLEIPAYLEEAVPEMSNLKINKKSNAYDVMNMLMAFTFENIKLHNYKVLKRCF